MGLNIANAFKAKNNVKRRLLSDFVTLKFIKIDKEIAGKPRVYLGSTSVDWYVEEKLDPKLGRVMTYLYFVATDSTKNGWANDANYFEVVRQDNTFLRYNVLTKFKPKSFRFEWKFEVSPNEQDVGEI